jgi:hypothetical protein
MLQQGFAGRGRRYARTMSQQQGRADGLFEVRNAFADGGGDNRFTLGRVGDAGFLATATKRRSDTKSACHILFFALFIFYVGT